MVINNQVFQEQNLLTEGLDPKQIMKKTHKYDGTKLRNSASKIEQSGPH